MTDLIETAPRMDLSVQDIEFLVEELRAYHAIYSPLFQRREQRQAAHTSLQGLLSTLPRKSIEPMVLALDAAAPTAVRALQSFISEGQWHDERRLQQHWREVARDLGDDDGVLMVDGSDFPKQGMHSVGVKRQYCGQLGKRANCQAGVLVGYVSCRGYTVLDRRLYVPGEWLRDDAYGERRQQGGIPPDLAFTTKPVLAREMRAAVVESQALRCRWVVADAAFGGHPEFLDGVAQLGLWYCAAVPHSPRVWPQRPATHLPPWRGRGPRPQRTRLVPGAPPAMAPETLVRMSGMRWPIETCFEDSKQLLGMGDDEVRSWTGWHHHMTLVILAHFFVVRMRVRLKKKPCGDVAPGGDGVGSRLAPTRVRHTVGA